MFKGSAVALVAPMMPDGQIDFNTLNDLVEWHISSGTQALIVNGTTGESATLSWAEQLKITKAVVAQVQKRVPIIVGTGTNDTQKVIERHKDLETLGVDGFLIVAPYYNKPTQEGLKQHYQKIAQNTSKPILLYNVPGRTSCDLLPDTVATLSRIPNIVGIKEASGDLERVKILKQRCGSAFRLYSGDDGSALAFIQLGGDGVISVTANVFPKTMSKMCAHALKGEIEKAKTENERLQKIHQLLFVESNPIPVKWALWEMGRIGPGIRLPLTSLSEPHQGALSEALRSVGE